MKKIIDYLEQLDLSESEAKLYITLLETGSLSVRELANKIGMNRTTAYLYIDQLIEKGLIMKIVKGSRTQVAPNNPEESLRYLMEEKLQKAKTIQSEFPEVVQTINASLPKFQEVGQSEIKFYKGINAVKKIYEEAFNGNEIRSYVKVEEAPTLSSNNVNLFNSAFKKNKKLKMWEIIYESPHAQKKAEEIKSQSEKYFYKFMPSDLKWSITSEDIVIYDGKVAIINWGKGKVSSVILQSADYYNNSKELFDFIWRMIPAN
jgi:sugar-specific transcriptional regulator TrmB